MESFLETLCSTSIANYLKIYWCLNAYSEQERKDEKTFKMIEFFQRVNYEFYVQRLEKCMVNGAIKYDKVEILKNINNVEFQICNKNIYIEL